MRLQDLVDKLQLKVKSYKRQVEESVSYLKRYTHLLLLLMMLLFKKIHKVLILTSEPEALLVLFGLALSLHFMQFLFGCRMNRPTFTSPNSGKHNMSWKRLKKGLTLLNLRSISSGQRLEKLLLQR